MDFKKEIQFCLDNGQSWTDIANDFAEAMKNVKEENDAEQLEQQKIQNVINALSDYFGEGSLQDALLACPKEEVKNLLDDFIKTYEVLENLTFPLRKSKK